MLINHPESSSNPSPEHDPSGRVGCNRSGNPQIPWAGRVVLQFNIVRNNDMGQHSIKCGRGEKTAGTIEKHACSRSSAQTVGRTLTMRVCRIRIPSIQD